MRSIKKHILFYCVILASLFLFSCKKYLDVVPKGYTLLKTVSDYEQWMNNTLYTFLWGSNLYLNTDHFDKPNIPIALTDEEDLVYTWTPETLLEGSQLWGLHYENISLLNSAIGGIDGATGGTAIQKASLKAEAMLGRAYEYFYLINEYGKSYDSTTAAKDPGVPLVLSDDVAQIVGGRNSVKEVHNFIIQELTTALSNLPVNNLANRTRGSKGAAYSVLARVYFYAHNYKKASENAQLALDNSPKSEILDYNTFNDDQSKYGNLALQPDVIYGRSILGTSNQMKPSLEYLQLFDKNDIRLKMSFLNLGDFQFNQRGLVDYDYGDRSRSEIGSNSGTSVQEMVLIIAEAAARENNIGKALELLNDLRKKRLPAESFVPYQSDDQYKVLNWILLERRFEFPFQSLRWFDMRRLAAEGRMLPVVRRNGAGTVIATLSPESPRYTFQIPVDVLKFHADMEQNP